MVQVFKKGRGLPVLLAVAAIVLAACGSTATTSPNSSEAIGANGNTFGNAQTASPGNGAGNTAPAGSGGIAANFANINSYKFKMSVTGGKLASSLAAVTGGTDTGATISMDGTIEVKPQKAYDITFLGMHMIGIGGYQYIDPLGTGTFAKSVASSQSLADSMSPSSMFGSAISGSDASSYTIVGTESKNGVDATHFKAGPSALADLNTEFGVTADTWAADVWVAKSGGYPVSMNILGKAKGGATVFQLTFDITNVNDSANAITAPA